LDICKIKKCIDKNEKEKKKKIKKKEKENELYLRILRQLRPVHLLLYLSNRSPKTGVG